MGELVGPGDLIIRSLPSLFFNLPPKGLTPIAIVVLRILPFAHSFDSDLSF